jgi:hypothetical protein
MLFYVSLPSWSNIKLFTMVDRESFSVFRVDHRVQKSGHPWYVVYCRTTRCSCSAVCHTRRRVPHSSLVPATLSGFLSPQHGASSGCGFRRRLPGLQSIKLSRYHHAGDKWVMRAATHSSSSILCIGLFPSAAPQIWLIHLFLGRPRLLFPVACIVENDCDPFVWCG